MNLLEQWIWYGSCNTCLNFFKICFASFWCLFHTSALSELLLLQIISAFFLDLVNRSSCCQHVLPSCGSVRVQHISGMFMDSHGLVNLQEACLSGFLLHPHLKKKTTKFLECMYGKFDELHACMFYIKWNSISLVSRLYFKYISSFQM